MSETNNILGFDVVLDVMGGSTPLCVFIRRRLVSHINSLLSLPGHGVGEQHFVAFVLF